MKDYSWIKPGVKALVIHSDTFPEAIGQTVTIKSFPDRIYSGFKGEMISTVDIEEVFQAERESNGLEYLLTFTPDPKLLEPVSDFPNWNAISESEADKLPNFIPTRISEGVKQ